MSTTMNLEDIEKQCDNIYEAVIVAAKRARQINREVRAAFRAERERRKKEVSGIHAEVPEGKESKR